MKCKALHIFLCVCSMFWSSSCVGRKMLKSDLDASMEGEYQKWIKQFPVRENRKDIDEYINTAREILISSGKDISVFPSPSVYLHFVETNTFLVVSYSQDIGDLKAYVRLDLQGNVVEHFYGYMIGGYTSWYEYKEVTH